MLNSVFLHECVQAGLTSAIVHASKILPMSQIPDEQREVALDLVYDRRREGYDPVQRFIEALRGRRRGVGARPPGPRNWPRCRWTSGSSGGSSTASATAWRPTWTTAMAQAAYAAVHHQRHPAGRHEGGRRAVRLRPDAVAVRAPVRRGDEDRGGLPGAAHGEDRGRRQGPHRARHRASGDVHDIGKNLVDIILSNNGYEVVNIGIKQPINAILDAAEQHRADAIGMSGLLVKSTVIMKENLAEMASRGVAERWPVLLGGAALTRAYVEDDLRSMLPGQVHYARDAFEGLSLMDRVMAAKRGGAPVIDPEREAALAARRERRERQRAQVTRGAARAGRRLGPLRRGGGRGGADAAVLRHPRRQGRAAGRLRGAARRAGHVPGPVGAARRPRRQGPVLRGTGRDRGPAAAAVLAGPADRRPGAGGGRGVRLLPRVLRGQRPGGARRERAQRSAPGSPSPGSGRSGGCAWPTSSGPRATSSTWWRCNWSPSASRSASTRRSCSPATSTATTWRCTACRCSSPRRWPSTGTGASAPS